MNSRNIKHVFIFVELMTIGLFLNIHNFCGLVVLEYVRIFYIIKNEFSAILKIMLVTDDVMGLFSRKRKLCRTHYASVMSDATNEALHGRNPNLDAMIKEVEIVDFQKCVLCKEIRGVERITKDMTDEERENYLKYRYDN